MAEHGTRRALALANRDRMQHSTLGPSMTRAVGATPKPASSRHEGKQMGFVGLAQANRAPKYDIADRESSLELHSRLAQPAFGRAARRMDGGTDRARGAEAWKENARKEQRWHSQALGAAEQSQEAAAALKPAPTPAPVPRGPDHLRHVGLDASASQEPQTHAERMRKLRTHGHQSADRLASQRIGEHAAIAAAAPPAMNHRDVRKMHSGQARLW